MCLLRLTKRSPKQRVPKQSAPLCAMVRVRVKLNQRSHEVAVASGSAGRARRQLKAAAARGPAALAVALARWRGRAAGRAARPGGAQCSLCNSLVCSGLLVGGPAIPGPLVLEQLGDRQKRASWGLVTQKLPWFVCAPWRAAAFCAGPTLRRRKAVSHHLVAKPP